MAEEQEVNAPEDNSDDAAPGKTGRMARIMQAIRWQWVVGAVVGLVVINVLIFTVLRMGSGEAAPLSTEVTLGEFTFETEKQPGNPITRAEFQLHISLLDDARYQGRALLNSKQHKLQQEIEQLLRQAHGADFDDPTLTELKRQLQAMINKTLGQRVVAEVLITELSVDRSNTPQPETDKSASANPESLWKEVEGDGNGPS